ncbi:MAG: translational GTPase TypA [Candidatus Caenarcaniphilales bacterium]|nr:translational GTPase TypA [Candidatus Caenarcaniphilales bacterium]
MTNSGTITTDLLRNIAIVAHVDHGKTTLVDSMFRQSGIFRSNEIMEERMMDSNPLEKERGITILAKNTAIPYKDYKINILDTPGHADFSGEVERVLNMVDGVLLVIDAVEGPMPQTRFVLRKALERHLTVVVVVNKVDRPASDPARVIDKTLDLFIELGADEDQLEFPVVYASGLAGKAGLEPDQLQDELTPLLETILKEIPKPSGSPDESTQFQVATLDYSEFLGRIVIGRISNGKLKIGQNIGLSDESGKVKQAKITKLFSFEGLKRIEVQEAYTGDIVAVAGLEDAQIGDTIVDPDRPSPLPRIQVEEPTLQMTFAVNSSPFAGREGKFVTSRQLRERLFREIKTNISLRVEETDSTDAFLVSGRGELHLGILIETLRREGYEFEVSKPKVLLKEIDGLTCEPYELVVCDVPEDMSGSVIEALGRRRGEMKSMHSFQGRTTMEFRIPSRGLLGFRSTFIRLTKGLGIMTSAFSDFAAQAPDLGSSRDGSLIAHEDGVATEYALKGLEDRGVYFITPGTKIYRGMIVGENNRAQDLVINVCKAKKLTNMRSAGAETLDTLSAPIQLTLEFALDFIAADELLEVTPESIRLRKASLNFK